MIQTGMPTNLESGKIQKIMLKKADLDLKIQDPCGFESEFECKCIRKIEYLNLYYFIIKLFI